MRARNKFTAVFSTAAMVAGGMVAMGAVSPAVAYSGNETINCKVLSTIAAWTSDFTLTFSPAAPQAGDTVTVTSTFDPGPTNGPVPVGPTNGVPITPKATVALTGAVTQSIQLTGPILGDTPAYGAMPAGTMSGTFIAANGVTTATIDSILFDSSSVDTVCNEGVDPATSPVPTTIGESLSVSGADANITAISNQVVTTHARAGDSITFGASDFLTNGAATASLCDDAGANCDTTTAFTIAGGSGSGSINVPAAFAGSRTLKLTSGAETALSPITILGAPTLSANLAGGGAGTTVTLTGTNWDPNQNVTVGGFAAGPPFPPPATSDAAVNQAAGANGNLSVQFTVNDADTVNLGAQQTHRTPPIFSSVAFAISGDECTAKVGAATTGDCDLLETVTLEVTAGDLKQSKVPGDVVLSGVQLDGTAQTATGSLQDVTVMDYRGGTLGWDLVGTFSGLNGPAAITPDKLSWTPSCAAAANNDDTVVVGGAAAFTNATTALPLCSVDTGLGADGVSGGDTAADAGLELDLLANQAAGNYTGTLTLTLS